MTTSLPLLRLLIGSVFISFSPVFINLAATDPDLAGFYRMLFAVLSLLPLFLLQKEKQQIGLKAFLLLALAGASIGIDFMCWHRSIALVGPGLSTLLGNFQVFFTALFSWLIFRERPTLAFGVAVLLAAGGLLLITGVDLDTLSGEVRQGVVFGLLTALFYSCYILLLKQALTNSKISGVTAILMTSLSCALFMLLPILSKGTSFLLPDLRTLLSLVAVGVLCTTFGWSLISTAMKQVPATLAGLVLLLQPALSFVWDVLLFKRSTDIVEYLGLLLILTAIFLGTQRRVS